LYRSGIHLALHSICQAAILPPYTTLDNFFRLRSAWQTPPPDWSPQTHPCFPLRGVGLVGAAPNTHQDQGSVTSRPQARRLPLAPVVPQKTVSALPRPIVYGSNAMAPLWVPFPYGSRERRRQTHQSGGRPSVMGGGQNESNAWLSTIFPTRLQPQPNRRLDLSQKLCGHPRGQGLA